MAAASRNMSACSWQAVSQVGCRLMVASSAKISRPRWPGARRVGDSVRTCSRKASISGARRPAATGLALRLLRWRRSAGTILAHLPSAGRYQVHDRVRNAASAQRNGGVTRRSQRGRSIEEIVDFERFVEGGEPFRAGGGAAAALFVDRKLQARRAGPALPRAPSRATCSGGCRAWIRRYRRARSVRAGRIRGRPRARQSPRHSESRAANRDRSGLPPAAACCGSRASRAGCAPRSSRSLPGRPCGAAGARRAPSPNNGWCR